jgi:hypothetical protein
MAANLAITLPEDWTVIDPHDLLAAGDIAQAFEQAGWTWDGPEGAAAIALRAARYGIALLDADVSWLALYEDVDDDGERLAGTIGIGLLPEGVRPTPGGSWRHHPWAEGVVVRRSVTTAEVAGTRTTARCSTYVVSGDGGSTLLLSATTPTLRHADAFDAVFDAIAAEARLTGAASS